MNNDSQEPTASCTVPSFYFMGFFTSCPCGHLVLLCCRRRISFISCWIVWSIQRLGISLGSISGLFYCSGFCAHGLRWCPGVSLKGKRPFFFVMMRFCINFKVVFCVGQCGKVNCKGPWFWEAKLRPLLVAPCPVRMWSGRHRNHQSCWLEAASDRLSHAHLSLVVWWQPWVV